MSRVQDEVVLVQPLPYFGAVKEKTDYRRWVMWTLLLAVFAVASFFAPSETLLAVGNAEHSVSSFTLAVSAVGGVVWFFYSYNVFTRSSELFRMDALRGREEWVRTELRSYLNKRYGTDITMEQAERLLRSGAYIDRHRDGRVERVHVVLNGWGHLRTCVSYGEHEVHPVPDVSELDFELMIIEEPQKPRMYSFSQD